MARYGYLDMSDEYTDIGDYDIEAICPKCGRRQYAPREGCWEEDGRLVVDDLCSEYDEEHPDTRQNEW